MNTKPWTKEIKTSAGTTVLEGAWNAVARIWERTRQLPTVAEVAAESGEHEAQAAWAVDTFAREHGLINLAWPTVNAARSLAYAAMFAERPAAPTFCCALAR